MVRTNPVLARLLDRLGDLGVPAWYVGAGGVAQTVWNHLHGFAPTHAISDYDIATTTRTTSPRPVNGGGKQR